MPKQKLKKFERSKSPPKFRINETDFKILQDLGDYRYLDARQILALHKEANERTEAPAIIPHWFFGQTKPAIFLSPAVKLYDLLFRQKEGKADFLG